MEDLKWVLITACNLTTDNSKTLHRRTNKNKLSNNVEAVDKIKDTYERLPYHIISESNSMKT